MSEQFSTQNALVHLDNVGVYRDGKWLVRGVTFDVHPQEIVTLIGPNGSGKSTSVKAALGVLSPTEGQVVRQSDLQVGYVPQKFALDWTLPMPVKRLMNLTQKHSHAEIERALELVGIAHLKSSNVQSLSGGETQRALLARALLMQPDLLVLDEPVQGVDFAGEIALYDLIKTIRDETGCGILLISHDLHVVMAQTDTVICMNGHVCCRGTPKLVAESDEYRRLFGARAAQSLAVYEHDHDHTHLPDGRVLHADGSIHEHCDHSHDAPREKEPH
ncbi:ATP-binding cassette domain-containing protein [Maritalea mediterranea]|uniref:ATP-binding cassette domain-containing protein n=1 Tax=Maritalea mediterranea TaxID=2909667 RepID=UPI0034E206D4